MKNKFGLIIPVYKAHDTIHRALDSIVLQTRANQIKVFIVNDCDPTGGYSYLLQDYKDKLNIDLLSTEENGGPTAARNVGIEAVIKQNIPYILFMDSDDMFYSPLTIEYFVQQLREKNYDFIYGNFMEEIKKQNANDYVYKFHEDDKIWLFGKLYKTRIIRDHNIRFFHPSQNEDVGFNLFYNMFVETTSHIDRILYLWKWNSNSITRQQNGSYEIYSMIGLYQNCLQVFEKLQEDHLILHSVYRYKVIQRMILMYIQWNNNYYTYPTNISQKLFQYTREFYFKYYQPIQYSVTKNELIILGTGIFRDDLYWKGRLPFMDFIKKLKSINYQQLYKMSLEPLPEKQDKEE